jgi:hypothetical protein
LASQVLVSLGMTSTVKQPAGSGLCLAACAATLLKENKAAFNAWTLSGYIRRMPEKLCPQLPDRRYMEMSDLTIVLALRGLRLGSWWNSGEDKDVDFSGVEKFSIRHEVQESPGLVIVRCDNDESTHAVVYDNDIHMMRDPSSKSEDVRPVSDYSIVEWYPVDYFERPEK